MRVLVTNTQTPQAYAVIRALRPHAERVVAMTESNSRLARLAHAAHSRLVDRRYAAPSPVADWAAGRIQPENTESEAAFVEAALRICADERIDVIFPSWDPYVYVLAKNKARFAAAGILVPTPDFDIVLPALDKYLSVRAAERAGVPCPRTYLYEHLDGARAIAERESFPLVIKPRFTSGGRGMAVVSNFDDLAAVLTRIPDGHCRPMIQEYIPGGDRGSVQFVLDRDGAVLFAFRKMRHRKLRRTARYGTVSETAALDERVRTGAKLLNHLGWWGAAGIETIRDPRDGLDKLMEINPRFPRQLWNRTELGINEPLMCIQVARRERAEPVAPCQPGILFVSPVEDLQLLALQLLDVLVYAWRTSVSRRAPLDALARAPAVGELLSDFADTYSRSRRRVWDPYFGHFLSDPVAALLWWLQFSTWMAGAWRELGR